MREKSTIIMNGHDIERSLTRMALQIMEDNRGIKKLALIGIHTGGVFLADRLRRIISEHEGLDLPVGYLDITLYRDDWSLVSQNPIVKKTEIAFSVEEYTLILVDDVLYTGRTIRAALDGIMDLGRPRAIQLAVLINRKCGRELPIQPNYSGLDVQENVTDHVHVILQEKGGMDEVVLEFD
ncbi:MAG: bifunctional pyr operon transcriptional regulator/uracil phosphoribosyltransferase PyrR [Deltaproteobacteria bacterium]|nr:bifunctional pyr operon transcriptional regulator/uracil phosphoribosyltransferase PyrR [Deltaproteobacteria bacterium]